MLKHPQLVISPLEMNTGLRNSEGIFGFRIDIRKVLAGRKCRSLNRKTDGSGVAALDFPLERRAEPLDFVVVPGELGTTSVGIDGIAADKFFFAGVFQILPAWHPGDCVAGDVVGKIWLAQELRQIATGRGRI